MAEQPSLYERMKARGVDMSWYRREGPRESNIEPALDTEYCSVLSIYLLKQDGSLWTTKPGGKPYAKVREGKKEYPKDTYLCLCCKVQSSDFYKVHEAHTKTSDLPPVSA